MSKTQKAEHQTTLMLWEGNRQIQEYTDDFVFTTVYDQDSFEAVARVVQVRNSNNKQSHSFDDGRLNNADNAELFKVYHYHNNHLGTPQELTDECGNVVWCNYEWAWGGRYTHFYKEQFLNDCAILEHDLQPIRFQGQFYDVETGLHYNRFRYYDSDVGMLIQRDPIGLLGGVNVFQYAPNPILFIDPLGLIHKNSKDYKGPFVLYAIWDSPEKKVLLKIGKADAIRIKKSKPLFGKNGRMHDSERLARKSYPTAHAEIIQDLGEITTGEAEAKEARLVRALRKKGVPLPLNQETRKMYKVNSACLK